MLQRNPQTIQASSWVGSPQGKLGSHRKQQQFFLLSDSSLLKHPHATAEEAGTATFRMTFKNQGCADDGH